jgi:hypothetical protein
MSARFVWSGLEELKAALRNLPADLTGEASHVIEAAGNGAATTIKRVYGQHRVTGHLQNSVSVQEEHAGPFAAGVVVKSSDPIAWLFDHGSQARHWAGGKSTGRMWGRTPPTHIFAGTMARERRRMYGLLRGILERHGLVVSGDGG